MGRIGVYVADWQALFRKGIRFVLSREEDMEVVGDADSCEEALKYFESNHPDVAIFNINLFNDDSNRLKPNIKQNFPSIFVITVLDQPNDDHLFEAIKSGASACITKDLEPGHLISTIRDVAGGAKPIIKELLKPSIARYILGLPGFLPKLSTDDADILTYIAKDTSDRQTALIPGVDENTLNVKLASILSELAAYEKEPDYSELSPINPVTESLRRWGIPYKGGVTWTTVKRGLIPDAVRWSSEKLPADETRPEPVEEATYDTPIVSSNPVTATTTPSVEVAVPTTSASGEPTKKTDLKKILWVDRDLTSSTELLRVLRIAGFEVLAFADAGNGLQKIKEASLIVLDDESLFSGQVYSLIRSQSSAPIVIIGADKSEEVRDKGQAASANAYLDRSIKGRELVARIRSILRRC